ncbi:MAG TPA: DinB family protein [Terriglobales bacterium]|nr:DinB family protein [Terriglobales bacterium]
MTTAPQSATERDQLLALLDQSTQVYLNTISSVPAAAVNVKPTPECWSILEVAEHIAVAEHGMYRAIELAAEKTTPTDYDVDQKIILGGANREFKFQAPEKSHPKGRWKTLAECVEAFKTSRARSIEFLKSAEALRNKQVQHPALGPVDAYQCALIMAKHVERHSAQIEEIKHSEAYREAAGE